MPKFPKAMQIVRTTALSVFMGAAAHAAHAETTLYINGKIYTGAAAGFAQAMAVTDEKIAAVGTTADIQKLAQNGARVIDLHGSTVIPGLIDSHTHALFGSLALNGLNLATPEKTIWPDEKPDELIAALRTFAAAHPTDKILFARTTFDVAHPPSHEILDRAIPDRPLVVHNVSEHALWVNAKMLALAGITNKPLPDASIDAGISRNPDGSPTGVIREGTMEVIEGPALALLTKEQKLAVLKKGFQYLNSFGITMINNATGSLAEIELYGTLRDQKQLTLRTRTAFGAVAAPHHLTPQFLKDIEEARTRFHDDWVSSNLIKFFMDGSSAAPWPPIYTPEEFKTIATELNKRGFKIMTHALQAQSVTMALNVYEQIEAETGKHDQRFRIEHGDRLTPADFQRFSKLSLVASMQPSFCCGPAPTDGTMSSPWRSLLESGAHLAFSSDWPCSWPPSPMAGIQQAVTRDVWVGRGYGGAQTGRTRNGEVNTPSERLTVTQALDAYTKGGAYAAFVDDKLGTLEPGKLADFAVLAKDIFTIPGTDIGSTTVKMTVVGGKMVYGSAP